MSPCLPQDAPSGKPKLLDQVRELLRVRRYSVRTEEAYVGWIRRYIFFHGKRHPAEMGEDEVTEFLSHGGAKRSFEDKCVPKYNLGTRARGQSQAKLELQRQWRSQVQLGNEGHLGTRGQQK
jgi:hypothetical protein